MHGGEIALSRDLWSSPSERPYILKRLRDRFDNKQVEFAEGAMGVVVVIQQSGNSRALLKFLSRLARQSKTEILEMTPTPNDEIRLLVSVQDEEELRNQISTWQEVSHAREDGVVEGEGKRSRSYLRVVLVGD